MEPIDVKAEEAEEVAQRPEPFPTPFDPNRTLIAVIELSKASGSLPGSYRGWSANRPIRQCSGATGNDPTRVALPRVPEVERLGQVV
jgi:hypothetical protein